MGVCDSTPDREDQEEEATSDKRGDAAAAVAQLEEEEEAGRRSRANSDALAGNSNRTITVVVAAHGDLDLPDIARGKCITWDTQVNDTTTIDKVCTDWYMCKTDAGAQLDWLGDVGALDALIPQWVLLEEEAPTPVFADHSTFAQVFAAHPPPPYGAIRFVGRLKHTYASCPDPNSKIDLWHEESTSTFWDPSDKWIELLKLMAMPDGSR